MNEEIKYYYIPSKNKIMKFIIEDKCTLKDGKICYLATDASDGNTAWLYDDKIELCINSDRPSHSIISAHEIKNHMGSCLDPHSYVWGGEIRDKLANSMCARPYFR